MKALAPIFLCLLLAACATPIRSTVDGYGEAPLARSEPLFFDREAVPLPDKPIADSCRDAARDNKIPVSVEPCAKCRRVEVRALLKGTSQAVRSSGPSFGTSVGFGLGGATGLGIGMGSGNTSSHPETERVIEIGIFDGKNLLRSITARSVGRDNSVSAVAYEMCAAAFRDYPKNLRGKVYEVKPGEKPE
jgi:hypothetical protein